MYLYQVQIVVNGQVAGWETVRTFSTEKELREWSLTDDAHTYCWGRGFRWVGPDGQEIDTLS